MRNPATRILLSAALAAAVLGPARAQYQQPQANRNVNLPAQQTQAVVRSVTPSSQPSVIYAPQAAPAAPYYPYPEYKGAYGGYLSGASDVINAQAGFMTSKEQAKVTREQANQAKIDTRRKMFEQMMYEKANTPTLEETRQMDRMQLVQRARNNPPLPEIWSGTTLNVLLTDIQQIESTQGVRGPLVPLDERMLGQVNVSTGTSQGSVGQFKGGTQLQWPVVLQDTRFADQRAELDKLSRQAVQEATAGGVNGATANGLDKAVRSLKTQIKAAVADLTPTEYIQAMRYANELGDGLKMLQQPGAANYFNGKFQLKARNVGELVTQMTQSGLRFAPATQGSENDYTGLYQALATYDMGISRLVADSGAPRPPQ